MKGEETSGRRLRLRGRVQGVGFRYFTRRLATSMGLRGAVRNLSDGSVEVLVAGPERTVEAFVAALAEGPSGARVTGIDEERLSAQPAWEGFEITY